MFSLTVVAQFCGKIQQQKDLSVLELLVMVLLVDQEFHQ